MKRRIQYAVEFKMELFAEIVKGFRLLTLFAKSSILHIWLGSEYASEISKGNYFSGSTIVTCVQQNKCSEMFDKNWLKSICYFAYFTMYNHYFTEQCEIYFFYSLMFSAIHRPSTKQAF